MTSVAHIKLGRGQTSSLIKGRIMVKDLINASLMAVLQPFRHLEIAKTTSEDMSVTVSTSARTRTADLSTTDSINSRTTWPMQDTGLKILILRLHRMKNPWWCHHQNTHQTCCWMSHRYQEKALRRTANPSPWRSILSLTRPITHPCFLRLRRKIWPHSTTGAMWCPKHCFKCPDKWYDWLHI